MCKLDLARLDLNWVSDGYPLLQHPLLVLLVLGICCAVKYLSTSTDSKYYCTVLYWTSFHQSRIYIGILNCTTSTLCVTIIPSNPLMLMTLYHPFFTRQKVRVNSSPGQNGRHFADDIFKCISWLIYLENSPLVQVMVWRQAIIWTNADQVRQSINMVLGRDELTNWNWNKTDATLQMAYSNSSSVLKMVEYSFEFHWTMWPRVNLKISQHCHR